MANRSVSGYIKDANGVSLAAVAKTADFYSEWMPAKGDFIGVAVYVSNSGGTSMTLDCKLEASPDSGTTVFTFSDTYNSATQAALTQFASIDDGTGQYYEYFINPFPELAGWEWRVFFDHGGTVGTNTITAWHFNRTTAEELR